MVLVNASLRQPWPVIAFWAVLSVLGLYITVTRFAITTETDQLLRTDAAWANNKLAYEKAFPQLTKVILAVVDGATPEQAEAGAAKLTETLSAHPGSAIEKAWRPDGGPFFQKNGLLFLPTEEVRQTIGQLTAQAPVLLGLSGDPSLRGLLRLLQLGASQGALADNAALLSRLNDVLGEVLEGKQARLSWQELLAGGKAPDPNARRKFVLVDPELNYKALEPAAAATDRIRAAAAELGLTPENGVTVRLTGLAPLADEEFATVKEGAPVHLGLSIAAIAVILYLALRSGRIIAAMLATTAAGLVVTIGAGLLMVGRFNVISVAVAALFLGLGVDFGIQVSVRYRDERFKCDDLTSAMRAAARGVGWSLTLAAASLLVGFFSFLPTDFRGVSELGLITGVGMIFAFLASLTLLPALIAVLRPSGESSSVENKALAALDHWILAHRRAVVVASIALVLAGLPFLTHLHFDANPMHLRSEKTEAVATFLDLSRRPGMTPNTIGVIAPSLDEVRPLAAKLASLPEVAAVRSVFSLIPENQEEKLAIIREGGQALAGLTSAEPPRPVPTDAELVDVLRKTGGILRAPGGPSRGPPSDVAKALANNLDKLADGSPQQRAAAQTALTGDLPGLLSQIGAALTAEPVSIETLPADLRDDWITKDGRARLDVSPKGDSNDNPTLQRFAAAVTKVAPNATGGPIEIVESGKIIVWAFIEAGLLALVGVFVILALALRHPKDVALTLGPLVIATVLTLEFAQLIGMPLNLANVIALPLMLAVGVAFHIYYMVAWRSGVADMLASSLTRAIFFSSLTTGAAFGSLWLSNHPGTASMGKLLTISLAFTLLAAFIMVPAFLGPPRQASGTAPDTRS